MLVPQTLHDHKIYAPPPPMKIDPERTLVTCFQFGGYEKPKKDGKLVPRFLSMKRTSEQWLLDHFPLENIFRIHKGPYLCARNGTIRDFVLPQAEKFDWLLSIDHDVTITNPGIHYFLAEEGDAVSCKCRMPKSHAWDHPNAFHTAFYRVRIEVLQAIEPPWFDYPYTKDRCKLLSCDCIYFAMKALELGFKVTHAGHCGHDCSGTYDKPFAHREDVPLIVRQIELLHELEKLKTPTEEKDRDCNATRR